MFDIKKYFLDLNIKNYIVLTGFLIGIMVGIILVGRQITIAYEDAIYSDLQAKLLQIKASEAEMLKKAEELKNININVEPLILGEQR